MSVFTKELRQQIIQEFATRHNGYFNPKLFVDEVRRVGESHPAYRWFQWDTERALEQYWLWQAREFAKGLKVTFSVEEIGRNKTITVREVHMPFAISPVANRSLGGGYIVSDPSDPAHMDELCRQAATDLERWMKRYGGALVYAGGSISTILRQLKILESKTNLKDAA